ncbi:MAG: hypothetical protein J5760_03795 [Clostridia bacterium]|nr:hypothetical protein [Clostridia bacterium]
MSLLTEALAVIFSSSGIIGAVIAAVMRKAMKNAAEDAERRRREYVEEQMARYELDHASYELLIALSRFSRKMCSEAELEIAEANYNSAVNKADMTLKKNYISHKR